MKVITVTDKLTAFGTVLACKMFVDFNLVVFSHNCKLFLMVSKGLLWAEFLNLVAVAVCMGVMCLRMTTLCTECLYT